MFYINWILFLIYGLVALGVGVTVLMENRQPTKALVWLLVLVFIPVVGIILYFFFGQNTRKERIISQQSLDQLSRRSMLGYVEQKNLTVPEEHRSLVRMLAREGWALPFKNNEVEMFTDGHQFFTTLLREIAQAKSHIHIDTYIFNDDALGMLVADALIDKAEAGVEVRVIYDSVGSWGVKSAFFERMRDAGVDVHAFMPVKFPAFTSKVNYRNHRKLCVIDGRVGFIGGMNIAERYVKGRNGQTWRDTHLRIVGGAVYGIQSAFLVDWFFVDRTLVSDRKYYPELDKTLFNDCLAQVVTSNPTSEWPEMMNAYVRILMQAKKYVYMETPYFLPTETFMSALRICALSGVDVKLMIPAKADAKVVEWASRSYVMQAADDGVDVWLYQKGFNHSKLLIADDTLCTCGSTNIDFRSFENNFEGNIFFYDTEVTKRMKQVFLDDMQHCVALKDLPAFTKRSFFSRLWESIVRLFAPLL